MGDMSTVLGSGLAGYRELVTELGTDPLALLADAGVDPADVGRSDVMVPFHRAVRAVESAASLTGAGDFGRRLAERQGIEILGPVGAAARSATNVADALTAVGRYLVVYSPAIVIGLDQPDGWDDVRFSYHLRASNLPAHPQTLELALGVTLQILRLLAGPDFRPTSVHFPHAPVAPPASYRSYFGCRAEFAAPFTGFGIRPEDLARPVSSDDQLRAVVRAYLDAALADAAPSADVVETVAAVVRRLLPATAVDLELVAAHLAVHPRTLQRQLAARGTTFAAILDAARRGLAIDLLRDTDLPLEQIAQVLKFSQQSVLSRAARRWFGSTPRQARLDLRRSSSQDLTVG